MQAGARDEFQHKKWECLHVGNAYFAKDYDGPEDPYQMLRQRMAGRAMSEINERHMAGTETLSGKSVLEIGFGGGWYLAQALREGARQVYGFEAATNIVRSASDAFDRLGIGPYEFHMVDKRYLRAIPPACIDVAFSITVFQHIHPRATRNYLRTVSGALAKGGYCLFQFVLNEKNPAKSSNVAGQEGAVAYTKAEVDQMVSEAGLRTIVYAETYRDAGTGNYWAWYKLAKNAGRPGDPPPPAKTSDNIPHIKGLIPPGAKSILDVGCGMLRDGSPPTEDVLLALCSGRNYAVTGIDLFPECVRWRNMNGPPGKYMVMDAMDVHTLRKRFDVIVCHHVIEHLAKDDGERLLGALEGMYDGLLVVAAPAGFVDTSTTHVDGTDLEMRLSGWDIAEFRDRGYYVRQIKNQFIAFKTTAAMPAGAAPADREADAAHAATPSRRAAPADREGAQNARL